MRDWVQFHQSGEESVRMQPKKVFLATGPCPPPLAIDFLMHLELVGNFFGNANDMLQAYGEIHVTPKTSPPFCHWNILELARRNDDFKMEDYPGYSNKRGEGDRCDQHFPLGESSHTDKSDSALKRSRQLQGNPMEIWKRQKITFDRGIPQTTFSMNSKDLDDA
ncbi:hypothetical protein NC651_027696 [Populus alba x Populus x berolinensis]|nr:hypothetical protein NC651_027696 [Populus alba x Populus x berolinensis]